MVAGNHYDCNWTLAIASDVSCGGHNVFGCTHYDQKTIYLSEKANACHLWHEITHHTQHEDNTIHYGDCWRNLKAEQQWNQLVKEK